MSTAPSLRADAWPTYWAVLLAFFLLLQSVALAITIPRGNPPDEMAHISYVVDATHSAAFQPNYANGEILGSGKKNYLGHPPLYYSVLGIACKILGLDPVENYKALRTISGVFVALGFFFWLLTARNFGVGLQGATLLTLACCSIPMFGYLSGSVNNDTLVYLGLGACFWGVSRFWFDPASKDAVGITFFTLGVLVTFLTKATGAAFLTFFIIISLALRWRDLPAALRNPLYLRSAAAVLMVCGGYYLYAMVTFGSPMPTAGTLYAISPPSNPDTIPRFSMKFAQVMWERLPIVMSHASISPIPDRAEPFFYAMILLPLLGWGISRPWAVSRGAKRQELVVADAFAVALACTVAVYIRVCYSGYLSSGLYAGWQPRYLFFSIPGIWLLMSLARPPAGLHALVSAGFAFCACVAFWFSVPFLVAKQPERANTQNVTIQRPAAEAPRLSIEADRSKGPATGHLDEMKLDNRKLSIRGWTFDTRTSRPTQRIWILSGNDYLGSAPATIERPDVARALKTPSALKTGFSISVGGLPKSLRACEIGLLAELEDGTLSALRTPDCPPEDDSRR